MITSKKLVVVVGFIRLSNLKRLVMEEKHGMDEFWPSFQTSTIKYSSLQICHEYHFIIQFFQGFMFPSLYWV